MGLDLSTSLSYCTFYPKLCRHACPVSNVEAKETFVPQSKMALMRRLRRGETEKNELEAEALYACSGCGACTDACLHGIEVGPALFRGRAESPRHPALRDLEARFFAHAQKASVNLRKSVPAAKRSSEARVAFLADCESPETAEPMLALAERIGAEYLAVLDPPALCGGYPLFAAGLFDAFRLHAEQLAHAFENVSKLVVHCPACTWLMRTQYRAFGVPIRGTVEHTTEFLESFGERINVKSAKGEAFYHDSCYLGRHLGVYDAPRRLLQKALTTTLEFSRNRAQAECSGGGGLLPVTMPETADRIAEARLTEPRESKTKEIVTSCSTCKKRLARDGVKTSDLVELLERASR
jgi:Fe-S oxidoreductase